MRIERVADASDGVVADFDADQGWGHVRSVEGGMHFFHCTAIADGSRTIEAGRAVSFQIVPGRLGRWEAVDLIPR